MELITTSPVYHVNSTNESNPNPDLRPLIVSGIVHSLTFILSLLGNGVVIWVTGFKMKKTVNTVWFLNLAVADFLFTAFLPLTFTEVAMDYQWPFGKFMCKVNNTILILNLYTSVYILVVISVDRCVSVVWPVWAQNHRNVQKASRVCLCVWALALIFSAPYSVFMDTAPSQHNKDIICCFYTLAFSDHNETTSVVQLRLFRHQAMTITRLVLGFVIPFTVIVSCYAALIQRLKRNRTLTSQSSRPFKIIAAIIITFFLCWAPFHIMNLIVLMHRTTNKTSVIFNHIFTIMYFLALYLVCFNSCINPLLYVFMSREFKVEIRKSILKVLETAFQEEPPHFNICTNAVDTINSNKTSVSVV